MIQWQYLSHVEPLQWYAPLSWQQPLSTPPPGQPWLRETQLAFMPEVPWAPPPAANIDWYQPLSEPRAALRSVTYDTGAERSLEFLTALVTTIAWLPDLPIPRAALRPLSFQTGAERPVMFPSVGLSWYQELSRPVLRVPHYTHATSMMFGLVPFAYMPIAIHAINARLATPEAQSADLATPRALNARLASPDVTGEDFTD